MDDVLVTIAEGAAKTLAYAATLAAVGACSARWGLMATLGDPALGSSTRLMRRLSRLGVVASATGIVAASARLGSHTAVAFGIHDAFTWDAISLIALESQWGASWRYQLIASAAACVGFLWSARHASGWLIASAAAASACVAHGLLGHAAGDVPRVALHAGHIAGAGLWLGALGAVVLTTPPRHDAEDTTAAGGPHGPQSSHGRTSAHPRPGVRVMLLRRFAQVAVPGSVLLLTSGAWLTWVYVGSFTNLLHTPYGQWLLVKLLGVAGVLACGAINWRRLREPSVPFTDGTVRLELALALGVLVVTSVITELAHPAPTV